MITIVVVDDHKMLRQGIRSLLESESDLRVVAEGENGLDGLRLVEAEHPNVLISDLSMKGMSGIELCQRVRSSIPATECVILSMHSDDNYVIEALRVGVKGYVLKERGFEDVIDAVRAVAGKKIFLSKPLDERMAQICFSTAMLDKDMCNAIIAFRAKQARQGVYAGGRQEPVAVGEAEILKSEGPKRASSGEMPIEEQLRILREQALMDDLTGIGNRRYANISLGTKLEEFNRYGWQFGLILFDVDNFKSINDIFGHENGDRVLKTIAAVVSKSVRSHDSYLFRWGGDEFLLIVSNVNSNQLFDLCERIRKLVFNASFPLSRISISLGAVLASPDEEVESLISRVDANLYASKKEGKNRTTLR
jgi:diguanylate cyclase (GGDEF)-like protein